MKLDLDNDNVEVLDVSAESARKFFDGEEIPGFEGALDNAQGAVFSGEKEKVFLVLRITK